MTEKEWESDIKGVIHPWSNNDSLTCFGFNDLANLEQNRVTVRRAIIDPAKLSIFASIVADTVMKESAGSASLGAQRAAALVSPDTWKEFRYAVMWKIIDAKGKKIGDIPNIREIKETCCVSLPIHNDEIYNKYTIEAEKHTRNKKDKL